MAGDVQTDWLIPHPDGPRGFRGVRRHCVRAENAASRPKALSCVEKSRGERSFETDRTGGQSLEDIAPPRLSLTAQGPWHLRKLWEAPGGR